MRTTRDRIRHAISFELIALAAVTPLAAWLFALEFGDSVVVTMVSATIAMGWNYVYNLLFDHGMVALSGKTSKTVAMRILHAVLFEAGLLLALVPFIALYLGVSLWVAFVMNVAFSVFYLVYTFVFNWVYDVVFPDRAPVRTL